MARSAKVQPKGPDWTAEQTLRIIRQQLEKLQVFKGKAHREMANEEDVWKQVTQSALTHGFGEGSDNLSHFHHARWAGVHNVRGISDWQQQQNFAQRIEKFEANLRSSIAELEASMPAPEVRGAYDAGDEWAFYRDLKDIMAAAKADIFVIDNYLDTEFFELYVAAVRPGVCFRILTDQLRDNLEAVAKKYAASHSLELRRGPDVHDRHIFIDHRCWAIGQSIKDAAKKKPTYIVELGSGVAEMLQPVYEGLWARAAVLVKT